MVRLFLILTLLALHVTPGFCVPIDVHFAGVLLRGSGVMDPPVLLDNFPPDNFHANNARLRFHVPDAHRIAFINSMTVSVDVYDDGDNQPNELGELLLVTQVLHQDLPNLPLAAFGPSLNDYNPLAPLTVTEELPFLYLLVAQEEMQDDGYFLFRVNRDGGDFYVGSASVTMDAELIPEPATGSLAILALSAFPWRQRRRRSSRA